MIVRCKELRMKRKLKIAVILISLSFCMVVIFVVSSLRVSLTQMKSRTALALDLGASKTRVDQFLQSQHMEMTTTVTYYAGSNGTPVTQLIVKAQPLLSNPIYLQFTFSQQKLDGYYITDQRITGACAVG